MYDLIGDIHGHADELIALLELLGYRKTGGTHRHSERRAIFLGDFIDRGPKIRQVLQIVRRMVDSGSALAVLGNHELNALAYHTADRQSPGQYLRPRSSKNTKQHQATLDQLEPAELRSHLEWFRTLPMWLELDGLRAVHACWHEPSIRQIAEGLAWHGGATEEFLCLACRKEGPLFAAAETILKGKEAELPGGVAFHDKEGHVRTQIRTRWYLDPVGHTYKTYALQSDEIACNQHLHEAIVADAAPYPATAPPVFFGHYWLSDQRPAVLAGNVACLDYSVAKGGLLCAYRFSGEQTLANENFVWVRTVGSLA